MLSINKTLLAVSIGIFLSLPAYAQDLSSLLSERDRLFSRVVDGTASDSDVVRFDELRQQINELMNQKFQDNTKRINNLTNGLKRLEDQQNRVYNSLFGGGFPSSPAEPIQTQEPKALKANEPVKLLSGTVANIGLDSVVELALARNPDYKALSAKVAHYQTVYQEALAEGKDAINFLIPFRGFGPSKEGGDVILSEKIGQKTGLSAALYERQRLIDETHLKVVAGMLELAMGVGSNNEKTTANGLSRLQTLIGPDDAAKVLENFQSFSGTPREVDWSIIQKQDRLKLLLKGTIERDKVVQDIVVAVNKYNHRSKAMMTMSHIVEPFLGAASMTPAFIGPAARISLLEFVYSTGGSEEDKLLKEIYLDKRLESRVRLVAEEGHMALDAIQVAYLTKNSTLSTVAESLVEEMLQDKTSQVLQ